MFRHCLLNTLSERASKESNTPLEDIWYDTKNQHQKRLYELKFEYLTDLYDKYGKKMTNLSKIKSVALDIYSQFVEENSIDTINISATCRDTIKQHMSNIQSIDRIEDFLEIFNESIIEIWWLMDSVYRFQYLNHVKDKVVTNNNDNHKQKATNKPAKIELATVHSNTVS